jgi:hypothetical protein
MTKADVIIVQNNPKRAWACLGCLAFAALGLALIRYPEQFRYPLPPPLPQHSNLFVQITGYAAVVFFGLCLVLSLPTLVKPTTVQLSPDGLTVKTVWRSYTRSWSALDNFEIWRHKKTWLIIFDNNTNIWSRKPTSTSTRRSSLPGMLNADPDDLLEELWQAKQKWG